MKESIVLYSGGIDSTTALYWACNRFDKVNALSIDYGQRHRIELRSAQKVTKKLNVAHKVFQFDLTQIGGSALTDPAIQVPEFSHANKLHNGPPATYVPFRNGIFLSIAAAWAETKNIRDIICGFNVIDSPDYPDTSEAFVKAMQSAVNLGTKAVFEDENFSLHAPFISKKKSQIIREGLAMGADYSYSISCYAGMEIPCFKCSSCLLRQKAWDEVGEKDHLIIRLEKEGKI